MSRQTTLAPRASVDNAMRYAQERIREFCQVDGGLCVLVGSSQVHIRMWIEGDDAEPEEYVKAVSADTVDAMVHGLLSDPTLGPSILRATRLTCISNWLRWIGSKLGLCNKIREEGS